MLIQELKNEFHRLRWSLGIRGLLAITIGIFILVKPIDSVAALAFLIAWWALFAGITEIVHAIELRHILGAWWLQLLGGLVSVGFGVAALYYYPGLSLVYAVTLVGLWLLMTGTFGVATVFRHRSADLPWGWGLAWGILSIAAGIFALAFPPATLAAILSFIAAFALLSGVALLMATFRLGSLENRAKHATHPAPAA
jgi:uncharacterized membrane protein HdeD (DUF308 family)